jgi:hypothetical protein
MVTVNDSHSPGPHLTQPQPCRDCLYIRVNQIPARTGKCSVVMGQGHGFKAWLPTSCYHSKVGISKTDT